MATEHYAPTGAAKSIVIGTILASAFAFSLNAKGTILEDDLIIQAMDLDRYTSQWVTGPEGVVGLVSLFAALHLSKIFGFRRLFIAGNAFLAVGAVGMALAHTPAQDIAAGVVRSCSGLFVIPGLLMLQQQMPRQKWLMLLCVLVMVYGGQVLAEPIGALLAFHPSWRVLFLVIAGLGVWSAVCAWCLFPDDRPREPTRVAFDFAGAGLFASWVSLVLFLLYRGNYLGWQVSTPIRAAFAALALVTVLFVWRELVAPEPFIDLRVFRYRTVTIALLAAACWSASLYGVAIQFPQYLLLRGYEHWKAGWVMLPMGLVLMVTMFLGGFIVKRAHYVWALRIGLAGMAAVALLLSRVDLYTSWQWMVAVTCVWAFFAGWCLSPIGQLTFEGQRPEAAGATGAMKFLMRAFGGTLGILLAGVFLDRASAWGLDFVRTSIMHGQGALEADEPEIRDHMVRQGSAPAEAALRAEATLGYWVNLHAQVIGYRTALQFCAAVSALGLTFSFFIHRRKEVSVFDTDDDPLPHLLPGRLNV